MCTLRRRTLLTKLSAYSLNQQVECELTLDKSLIVANTSKFKCNDLSMLGTRDSLSRISKILR